MADNTIVGQQPIKLNLELTKRLRRIDESKINKALAAHDIPLVYMEKLLRKPLPKPESKRLIIPRPKSATVTHTVTQRKQQIRLPKVLHEIIDRLALHDEEDYTRRAQLFIGYCLYRNYTFHTVRQYYQILRQFGLFGQRAERSKLRLDPTAFNDRGRLHVRVVSMDNFRRFAVYLNENISCYTAPILVAMHTGLRTAELLQFTTYTLYQLRERLPIISIRRKQTTPLEVLQRKQPLCAEQIPERGPPIVNVSTTHASNDMMQRDKEATELAAYSKYWEPHYNQHLNMFIETLHSLYETEYNELLEHNQNLRLFNCTPRTLANRIRHLYYEACQVAAPHGFGIHSCRNLIAQLMAQKTDNIISIQSFLQHSHIKTTRRYIKADFSHMTDVFNRITNYELSSVRKNLKVPTKQISTPSTGKETDQQKKQQESDYQQQQPIKPLKLQL
jgi:hypothetical protein